VRLTIRFYLTVKNPHPAMIILAAMLWMLADLPGRRSGRITGLSGLGMGAAVPALFIGRVSVDVGAAGLKLTRGRIRMDT